MNDAQQYHYPEMAMTQGMSDAQRMLFLAQYHGARKDETVGVLMAVLLGHFGGHKFYMDETGLGILYLCFCWTGIPTILGFVEAFFMPAKVRAYNFAQASMIAAQINGSGLVAS